MSARIIDHYERVSRAREGLRHRLTEHAFAVDRQPEIIRESVHEIRNLIRQNRKFFNKHDYSWAARLDSYRNGLEAALQLCVLMAISDVSSDHVHYNNLGNICVRVAAMGGSNALSFEIAGFRYAVISNGLVKLLWEFLHTFDEVAPRFACFGKLSSRQDRLPLWTKNNAEEIATVSQQPVDKLINVAAAFANYKVPSGIQARYANPAEFEVEGALCKSAIVLAADAFIVLHEVGHLLAHGDLAGSRPFEDEVQADEAALSLMIILSSKISPVAKAYCEGIALAFATMRYANLVRRTFRHVENLKERTEKFDDRVEMKHEQELMLRSQIISRNAMRMGLPRNFTSKFDGASQEFFLLTEATKIRLAQYLRAQRSD